MSQQKVTPFLWFNDCAEEAAEFYVSSFQDSRITRVTPGPGGKAMGVEFQLGGVGYVAFNGGPHYTLNEAFSLSVSCESQQELDEYWERLVTGGQPSRCGWLKDKFGLSWQIVPAILPKLMADKDPVKAKRVVDALMQMVKLDIAGLKNAYEGT